MGRYTGPVERLSRREGVELELKGGRLLAGKSALERRPYPPGQHGRGRQRPSEYATRLREKQKTKRFYGLRERQFRSAYDRAGGGAQLLSSLEVRLDNVVYRLGFATTRAQARQFVVHGHVQVNGRKVDVPAYQLRSGDVVGLKSSSRVRPLSQEAASLVGRVPPWLLADHDELWGRVERLPEREDIGIPVDEKLIIEFYAK
jgi:small subunit ribosomal protein S4